MKPFTEEARYEYDLTPDSVVIDAGGYEGTFAAKMFQKYGCWVHVYEPVQRFCRVCLERFPRDHQKVIVHNIGISSLTGPVEVHVQNDSSGLFAGSEDVETVQMWCMRKVLQNAGPSFVSCDAPDVSLLKLNIEGSEFDVLENCIDEGLTHCFRNIQVQFHPVVPDYEARYQKIREALLKTHRLTFDAPWCWENYERL